jgi:ribosomal protein S18 acetylase RimI-like enzyme
LLIREKKRYWALLFKWGFSTFKRVFGFGLVMEEAHEKHMGTRRHWYLAVIGVDPEYQGRGLGTRLMEPIMILADEQKTEIYLECSKESNVTYYQRLNFEVLGIMRPKDGPPSWVMRRLPQPIN